MPIDLVLTTAITTLTGMLVTALYRKLSAYIDHSGEWRKTTDSKLDTLGSAMQTTMRATLIHNAEKYFERGWLTPEERASWCDMHDKYSDMGFNGLIDTYRHKLDALPDRTI